MRVVFIGKSHTFSMQTLGAIQVHHNVVGVVEGGGRGSVNLPGRAKTMLSRARAELSGKPSLKREARKLNSAYLFLGRNSREVLPTFLRKIQPDILCVASLSMLLPKEVLTIPRHGAINLHPSKLPKYPGPFPWFWQYHDCELEIGVTVHALDAGEDTGPILKQDSVRIKLGTDIANAISLVAPVGARLMAEVLDAIEAGTAVYVPQEAASHPRARLVSRNEKLVEWDTWPIERVWHFLRGTYPWIDAVSYPTGLNGKCTIGEIERGPCDERPGKVAKDQRGYYIAHGEGKIRLITLKK
jgi:methionyl-tRNA formyltransferase